MNACPDGVYLLLNASECAISQQKSNKVTLILPISIISTTLAEACVMLANLWLWRSVAILFYVNGKGNLFVSYRKNSRDYLGLLSFKSIRELNIMSIWEFLKRST